jgi:hypothetical protein
MKEDMRIKTEMNDAAAILARVILPKRDGLPQAAAQALLELEFTAEDRERMHELAVKNQDGKLSSAEKIELHEYLWVGRLLDLLSAMALRSLKKRRRVSNHG